MVITYHGGEMFKVTFGSATLAFNPIAKDSKLKPTRFGADIALISLDHPDFNGADQVAHGEKQPFIISGPGEYEVGGIFVKGFGSKSMYGGEESINTVYHVTLEGMNLLFLGALSEKKLGAELGEALEVVDVLFVPIGGEGVLTPSEANDLVVDLSPHIVVPMHYGDVGSKGALATFLKESGSANGKPEEKLTLKKKDLEGKEGEIIVLGA
jgi:L-ascorbate metabolism protein UlaG (beta-lactamase superfamily)